VGTRKSAPSHYSPCKLVRAGASGPWHSTAQLRSSSAGRQEKSGFLREENHNRINRRRGAPLSTRHIPHASLMAISSRSCLQKKKKKESASGVQAWRSIMHARRAADEDTGGVSSRQVRTFSERACGCGVHRHPSKTRPTTRTNQSNSGWRACRMPGPAPAPAPRKWPARVTSHGGRHHAPGAPDTPAR
jgi:hypothetical protein